MRTIIRISAKRAPLTRIREMSTIPAPGQELLRTVRAGFVKQGSSLGTWCRTNDLHLSNARQALLGSWDGPAGRALRNRIIKAAGVRAAA
jgi:hypothetical protein